MLLIKHKGTHLALGSFCGFDFTNLATGALIGEKLICPTCGSNYDINTGYVDQGPSMRNISSFVVQTREEEVKLVVPNHIPAFQQKKMLNRSKVDPRKIVVVGDSEAALSSIDALRTTFTGEIILIPQSPYGAFENTDVLNRKFSHVSKNEVFLVEQDYLDRANVTVMKGNVTKID